MNVEYKLLGNMAEILTRIPDERKENKQDYKYFCIWVGKTVS